MSTKLKLMGVDVASVGDAHAMTPNALSYFYADEDTQVYKKIVVNGEKTKLLGAVLVGCAKEYNDLLQMMLNGLALPENPESLIMPVMHNLPLNLAVVASIYCQTVQPFAHVITSLKPIFAVQSPRAQRL